MTDQREKLKQDGIILLPFTKLVYVKNKLIAKSACSHLSPYNLYSLFSASFREVTTSAGSGNFSLRGGPFLMPDHKTISAQEEETQEVACVNNSLDTHKLWLYNIVTQWHQKRDMFGYWLAVLPLSPSISVTSKLFRRGFCGLSTTRRSGCESASASRTPSAFRPQTRQLLL